MKHRLCIAAIAVPLLFIPARAEDCGKLISYGTIPLTQIGESVRGFVPVEIAGVSKLMIIDTGADMSMITSAAADELHLESTRTDTAIYDLTGAKAEKFVTAQVKIGNLRSSKLYFMLSPASLSDFGDPRVVGLLGADVLKNFDVSIDFGAHTLTLFSQDHCDGQVVYWPERPLAIIPFKLQQGLEIFMPVTLDGQEIKAQLDTGASTSTIEKSKAERAFDLVLGSADTPVAGDLNGTKGLTTWTHRFKSLSLAGIEVANPVIHLIPNKMSERINDWSTGTMLDSKEYSYDMPSMLLGMDVLKHLHIYIAYKEKKLYITPASEPAGSVPPAAAPAKPN